MKLSGDRTRLSRLVAAEMRYFNRPFAFAMLALCTLMLTLLAMLFSLFFYLNESGELGRRFLTSAVLSFVALLSALLIYRILKWGVTAGYSLTMALTAVFYAICASAGFNYTRAVWQRDFESVMEGGYDLFRINVLRYVFIAPVLCALFYLLWMRRPATDFYVRYGQFFAIPIVLTMAVIPTVFLVSRLDTVRILTVGTAAAILYMSVMLCLSVRYLCKAVFNYMLDRPASGRAIFEPRAEKPLPAPAAAESVAPEMAQPGETQPDAPPIEAAASEEAKELLRPGEMGALPAELAAGKPDEEPNGMPETKGSLAKMWNTLRLRARELPAALSEKWRARRDAARQWEEGMAEAPAANEPEYGEARQLEPPAPASDRTAPEQAGKPVLPEKETRQEINPRTKRKHKQRRDSDVEIPAQAEPDIAAQKKPETEAEPDPDEKSDAKPQAEAAAESTMQPQPESKQEFVLDSDTKPKTEPEPESKTEPESESAAATASDSELNPEPESEPGAEQKPDFGPETESEVEQDSKPESKQKCHSEYESTLEPKPGTESAFEPEPKPDSEAQPRQKLKIISESGPEPKPEPEVLPAGEGEPNGQERPEPAAEGAVAHAARSMEYDLPRKTKRGNYRSDIPIVFPPQGDPPAASGGEVAHRKKTSRKQRQKEQAARIRKEEEERRLARKRAQEVRGDAPPQNNE